MAKSQSKQVSAFEASGFSASITELCEEIQELYLSDELPWVIGYSGGKDSSAVTQLVWYAISQLEPAKRQKPVYVITTDTLVENPVVASWVNTSLETMRKKADAEDMPFRPKLLKPEVADTFWVNLIGKGYPAPRHKFRWCTERLKIKPTNIFINETVSQYGEVILLLGVRIAESSVRASRIKSREKKSSRDSLTSHNDLLNTLVYAPIKSWSNDDVWAYLMQESNPWGHSNKDLLSLYRGATADNECPIVVDTSTPSCGSSRFGCWVCTLVDQDKSMSAMIQNDEQKEWLLPLLDLRNELDFREEKARKKDRERRDFRRMAGHLSYYKDRDNNTQLVPGPYTQESREYWLRRVLAAQQAIRENDEAPEHVRGIELISAEELQEIRRIWVSDKHEIEDRVPIIYREETGIEYEGPAIDENLVYDPETLGILKECCGDDSLRYELVRNLLDIERQYRTKGARRGLFQEIEGAIKKCFYEDASDAHNWMEQRVDLKERQFVDEMGEVHHQGVIPKKDETKKKNTKAKKKSTNSSSGDKQLNLMEK